MKKIIIILLILLVVIQFIPSEEPQVIVDNPKDLIVNNQIPANIQSILKTSCYDCHSNETVLPWYSNFAPVSWLVNFDINTGREELNFSNWESLTKLKKVQKIEDCIEVIEEGEMPLEIYTLMHSDAVLDENKKSDFLNWAESYADDLFEE